MIESSQINFLLSPARSCIVSYVQSLKSCACSTSTHVYFACATKGIISLLSYASSTVPWQYRDKKEIPHELQQSKSIKEVKRTSRLLQNKRAKGALQIKTCTLSTIVTLERGGCRTMTEKLYAVQLEVYMPEVRVNQGASTESSPIRLQVKV